MAPHRVQPLEVFPLHEPGWGRLVPKAIATLRGRAVPAPVAFMVPTRDRKVVEASHESAGGARLQSSPDLVAGKDSRTRRSLAPPEKVHRPKSRIWTALWLVITALTPFQTLLAADQPASPLTPQQEIATFRLADENLTIELAAAEPNVSSPVAIAWDADGRLFVAEMIDYPTGPTAGQVRLLEDRDGDGRYEKATVFADQLPFPNSVLPWNGGVLVTAAPNIWFLKDTDGDGRADERRIVLTGFAEGNQQLRANGLSWGLDNWVYGANGRSDGNMRRPNDAPAKAVSLRRRDFRFRPDSGEFEAIAGPSQFGSPRDDWGNRFLSWNTIPIRHEVLEEHYLNRNSHLASVDSLQNLLAPGDPGQVFPLTPAPLVFNNESSSHFNALAGLAVYRGDALGAQYKGNALAGESLRNLVHRRVLEPSGVTFTAKRIEEGREFLASTDPWFHSVNFATGPDGALYVVDFYRRFVEHPDYIPGSLRAQVAWQTGATHGRIWRIKAKNMPLPPLNSKPLLSRASSAELVKSLSDPNGWWRDTAQRLLVERQDRSVVPLLKSQIKNRKSKIPLARLHALWTLEGLGALDDKTILVALQDSHSGIREHAVRLAEQILVIKAPIGRRSNRLTENSVLGSTGDPPVPIGDSPVGIATASATHPGARFPAATSPIPVGGSPTGAGGSPAPPILQKTSSTNASVRLSRWELQKLQSALSRLANDSEPRMRFRLALASGELPVAESIKVLTRLARHGVEDHWQSTAILSSIGGKAWPFFTQLVKQYPQWIAAPTLAQGSFLQTLSELVGVEYRNNDAELARFLTHLQGEPLSTGRVLMLAGMVDGMDRGNASPTWSTKPASESARAIHKALVRYSDHAAALAVSPTEPLPFRLASLRILAHLPPNPGGQLVHEPPLSRPPDIHSSPRGEGRGEESVLQTKGPNHNGSTESLLDLLLPGHSPEIQAAATRALMEWNDRGTATALFARWSQYSPSTRRQVISGALRASALASVLVEALEKGGVSWTDLDATARQKFQQVASGPIKAMAEKYSKSTPMADRGKVVQRFQASLKLDGSRPRGAATFAKACLVCHSIQGQGGRVGPDLSGIGTRPKDAVLVDILDPSRQITPDFINFTVETVKGEKLNGLLAAETATSIALRRAGEADLPILRREIAHLQAQKTSLMPEGFEEGLTQQDMADLLEFLQQPDKALLPTEK